MVVLTKQIHKRLSFLPFNFAQDKLRQESRKLRASTLIEVLVASVLIIVVFTIASLTLNNIFRGIVKGNTSAIEAQLNKTAYLYQHNKIDNQYWEDFKEWNITVVSLEENETKYVLIEAVHSKTKKSLSRKLVDERFQ